MAMLNNQRVQMIFQGPWKLRGDVFIHMAIFSNRPVRIPQQDHVWWIQDGFRSSPSYRPQGIPGRIEKPPKEIWISVGFAMQS